MKLQEIFKQPYWPIPTIEEIDDLIVKLGRLKDYFWTNEKIKTFNSFTYSQIKTNIIDWKAIPSKVTKIWDSLRELINNPIE